MKRWNEKTQKFDETVLLIKDTEYKVTTTISSTSVSTGVSTSVSSTSVNSADHFVCSPKLYCLLTLRNHTLIRKCEGKSEFMLLDTVPCFQKQPVSYVVDIYGNFNNHKYNHKTATLEKAVRVREVETHKEEVLGAGTCIKVDMTDYALGNIRGKMMFDLTLGGTPVLQEVVRTTILCE